MKEIKIKCYIARDYGGELFFYIKKPKLGMDGYFVPPDCYFSNLSFIDDYKLIPIENKECKKVEIIIKEIK